MVREKQRDDEDDSRQFNSMFAEFQTEVNRRDAIIDNYNIFIQTMQASIMYKNRDIVLASQKNKALLEENKKLDEEVNFHKEREKYLNDFIFRHTKMKLEDLDEFMTEEKYNTYLRKKKLREKNTKEKPE